MKLAKSRRFLATVSAVALIVATRSVSLAAGVPEGAAVPHVEEAADIWVAVEGRWNIFETDIFGPTRYPAWDVDPDDGWGGGMEVGGRPAGSDLDFVLRVIFNRAKDDASGLVYGEANYVNDSEVREQHIVADFEVGRQMNIGMGGQTRVHGGARFAYFDADMHGRYYYTDHFLYSQMTMVIGPRIGIDQDFLLGNNFSFGLSAAGAVLWGRNERDEFCTNNFRCALDNGNQTATVWNLEGSARLSYDFHSGSFEVGWRAETFHDVFEPDFNITGEKDLTTHGPYARLVYYLSGGPR